MIADNKLDKVLQRTAYYEKVISTLLFSENVEFYLELINHFAQSKGNLLLICNNDEIRTAVSHLVTTYSGKEFTRIMYMDVLSQSDYLLNHLESITKDMSLEVTLLDKFNLMSPEHQNKMIDRIKSYPDNVRFIIGQSYYTESDLEQWKDLASVLVIK